MSDVITLAHGAGGKQTAELIDRVFKAHFSNPQFTGDDAAVLPIGGANLLSRRMLHRLAAGISRWQYR